MCSGPVAAVSQFFVNHFWTEFQHLGVKDPTRAATNPGLCNEVDVCLHEWATRNDKGITAVIAGHTHRAVFENLSLSEIHLQTIRFKRIEVDPLEAKRDPRYYNTGSCVHPLSITGLEIGFDDKIRYRLIKWHCDADRNMLGVKRVVL
jgi:hypothetical protein